MKNIKKILSFILAVLLVLSFCACGSETDKSESKDNPDTSSTDTASKDSTSEASSEADIADESKEDSEDGKYADKGELKIRIFKVGKADAILFRTETKVILMDTGEDEDGVKILEYLAEKGLKTIDCMILTHFDKSAIGGADTILNSDAVTVKSVYQPNYKKDSVHYTDYANSLSKAGITPVNVTEKTVFTFDDVTFTVYPAEKDHYSEDPDNDFSLVTSVKHGSNSFLFAADAMNDRLAELMAMGDISHTFLKVPYNGQPVANSTEFINAVKPKYAAITCSDKNPPSSAIVSALEAAGATVYLTKNGNIKITSDGGNIEIVV